MTDEAAAASAAPEGTVASEAQVVSPPQPIQSAGPERQTAPEAKTPEKGAEKPEGKQAEKKPARSIADAIKHADATAREKATTKAPTPDKAPKAEAKPEGKGQEQPAKTDGPARGEGGRFAAKDGQQPAADQGQQQRQVETKPASAYSEAPTRFKSDPAAVEAWSRADEPLRAATHRAFKELEQGVQKHKEAADQWGELKDYDAYAKKSGTSIKQALSNYVNAELAIRRDPFGGLEKLVSNLGLKSNDGRPITFRDLASAYLGQKPDAAANRSEAQRHAADQRVEHVERAVQGILQHFQKQMVDRDLSTVESFAQQHPRAEELADDIILLLNSPKIPQGLTDEQRLSEAYKLAERLNPAPAQASTARAQTPDDDAEAQTLKGQKSITGAPSSGSDPATKRKPSSSIRESLDRAARQAAV